ncbi:MAG TPA: hypothetical protein VFI42_04205 [Thermomicrobiaceae bacterium]|nr:hypothetical protein [Thermomicrobiaceae bacterium]
MTGVYGGVVDKFPLGAIFAKGLNLVAGQTHVRAYLEPQLARAGNGEIDPTFVITHHLPLDAAPDGYRIFQAKQDGCIKVVLRP